jgi:hypothetical protein
MCVSTAIGRIWQVARKVEGLVVRLDRGSSNPWAHWKAPQTRGFLLSVGPCSPRRWERKLLQKLVAAAEQTKRTRRQLAAEGRDQLQLAADLGRDAA